VQLFSKDLQQQIKQPKQARAKKIPKHLQAKIGEANQMYTFGRFDEAIPLFEQVIKEMPELADVTHTMALIFEEKNDLSRAFTYALLSAIETRTDTLKWQQCARLALLQGNEPHAIYVLNRAIKALDKSQYQEILALKLQKI
jgi:predicted Zn-dependent protease